MRINFLLKSLLFCLPFVFLSCGNDEPTPEPAISADFDLIGTWNFEYVEAEGVVFGIPYEGDDPMPSGFVRFNNDGTGYSEFTVDILDNFDPYSKEEDFTWERLSESEVKLRQSDGETDVWTIIRGNSNLIEASWLITREGAEATLTSTFLPG